MKKIMTTIKNFIAKVRFVKGEKFKNLTGKERALKITMMVLKLAGIAALICTVGIFILLGWVAVKLLFGLGDAAQVSANVFANNKVWRRY